MLALTLIRIRLEWVLLFLHMRLIQIQTDSQPWALAGSLDAQTQRHPPKVGRVGRTLVVIPTNDCPLKKLALPRKAELEPGLLQCRPFPLVHTHL